ncbi:MAG: hypothetical protein E5Y32_23560 [Mesorhizobium sp.]|nr:MAG: hypothetical protein E5Y32_23560 [Mesorhizobium sp.]
MPIYRKAKESGKTVVGYHAAQKMPGAASSQSTHQKYLTCWFSQVYRVRRGCRQSMTRNRSNGGRARSARARNLLDRLEASFWQTFAPCCRLVRGDGNEEVGRQWSETLRSAVWLPS